MIIAKKLLEKKFHTSPLFVWSDINLSPGNQTTSSLNCTSLVIEDYFPPLWCVPQEKALASVTFLTSLVRRKISMKSCAKLYLLLFKISRWYQIQICRLLLLKFSCLLCVLECLCLHAYFFYDVYITLKYSFLCLLSIYVL